MSVHSQSKKWWDDDKDKELNHKVWKQIKENDPRITCLLVKEDNPFLLNPWASNGVHKIFSSNTNLKRITIYGNKTNVSNRQHTALKNFCKALTHNSSIEHLILKHWKAFPIPREGISKCSGLYIIGKSRSLRRLDIWNCNMKKDNWNRFAYIIEHGRISNSLEQLTIAESDLNNHIGGEIVSSLKLYRRLEKLHLGSPTSAPGSKLRNEETREAIWQSSTAADHLSRSLGKLLQCPNCNLQILTLRNHQINNNGIKIIANGLTRGNKSLQVLKLNDCWAVMTWGMFFTDITSTGICLEELDLSGNYINDKGIIALSYLLISNKTIRSLNLNHVRRVTEHCWDAFFSRIQDSALEKLNLADSNITERGLISIGNMMENNTTLKTLDLSRNSKWRNPISGWLPLFSSLYSSNSTLKRLNLSNNSLNDTAVGALARWLGSSTTLIHLKLDGCNDINPNGWIDFFRTLRYSNTSLKDLIVDNCNEITDAVVPTLVSSLSSIRSLDSLGMASCFWDITSEGNGWQTLATLLQNQNCMLTKLDIQENGSFDDDALVAFADALRNNSRLRELNLIGNNDPAESTWVALTDALCDETSIETLYNSNHTLQKVVDKEDGQVNPGCSPEYVDSSYHFPKDLRSVLKINRRGTKAQAASEKIIRYHMLKDNVVNIDAFIDMEQNELPSAISWLGRDELGLSVLYKLCKSLPDLFESKTNVKVKKTKRAKRKRIDFLALLDDV